jgi:hypothetical protein
LHTRYEQTARLEDLLRALRDARVPVTGKIAVALHRGQRLSALIGILDSRYQYTSDPQDLSEAIAAGRKALATLSSTDPNRVHYATELCVALCRSGDVAMLTEAVGLAEQTLVESSPNHVDHSYRISTLSMALFMRHLSTGDGDDLRRAQELAEEALAASAIGSRNHPLFQQRMGLLARRCYDVTADVSMLTRGIEAIREALSAVDHTNPVRGPLICELADLLLRKPDTAVGKAEALKLLAAEVGKPGPALTQHNALRAARQLGQLGVELCDGAAALSGHRRAVELLPIAAWPGLSRAVREARLAEAPPATDAAAQALLAGDRTLALELLELGRSVLWSQQLAQRSDLAQVSAIAPELAERLDEIRHWFERPDWPQ